MKLKPFKRVPLLVASAVILLVCLLRWVNPSFCERVELMTFDARVRLAQRSSPPAATNLGFVFMNEESVARVWDGSLGFRFGLLWPRQVHGRLVAELAEQQARAIGFDVLFGELRPDHPLVQMADGTLPHSDEFLANQCRRAGNVTLAATRDVIPPALFKTNASELGDITTEKDADGVLRRAKAFRTYYRAWHSAFRQLEADPQYGVDLSRARVEPGRIVLPTSQGEQLIFTLDAEGTFDLADFYGEQQPAGLPRRAKPFVQERVWHLGLVLAARALGLDLNQAEVNLDRGYIRWRRSGGGVVEIPVDQEACLYVDWTMTPDHPQLTRESIHDLLAQYKARLEGRTNEVQNRWRDKLVFVGSSAMVGNNLTDRGATPLSEDTLLVSEHWNVANSILTGRFVRRAPLLVEFGLIGLLGIVAAISTWRLRVLVASGVIVAVAALYLILAAGAYAQSRYWLPLVYPLAGALLMTHICLVTWRVVFEQAEQRRVRSVFSTVVSPKIVQELLQTKVLSLEGARRQVTVMFADVRGFTELTDAKQEQAEEFVRQNQLSGSAAEACFDQQARETLETVNSYLALVANTVIQHDGTLDKFIGDCVMAFWGAPTANTQHALGCVRAAIEAQRAIYELNRQRRVENTHREQENVQRQSAGLAPRGMLPILHLGTGINTGTVTVGLMGLLEQDVVRQANYTVFGREVNLASRLESASGRGRIFISQSTLDELQRDDPALAATCVAFAPILVKGIRHPVAVYEVPWLLPNSPPIDSGAEVNRPETKAPSAPVRDPVP